MDPLISVIPAGNSPQTATDAAVMDKEECAATPNGDAVSFGDVLIENLLSLLNAADMPSDFGETGNQESSVGEDSQSAAGLAADYAPCILPLSGDLNDEGTAEVASEIVQLLRRVDNGSSASVAYSDPDQSAGYGESISSDEILELQKILAAFSMKAGDAAVPAETDTIADDSEDTGNGETTGNTAEDGENRESDGSVSPSVELSVVYGGAAVLEGVKNNSEDRSESFETGTKPVVADNIRSIPEENDTATLVETMETTASKPSPVPVQQQKTGTNDVESEEGGGDGGDRTDIKDNREAVIPHKTAESSGKGEERARDADIRMPETALNESSRNGFPSEDEDSGKDTNVRKTQPSQVGTSQIASPDIDSGAVSGNLHAVYQRNIVLESTGEEGALCEGFAHVVSFLKDEKGDKKGVIRLEPPELGSMKVEISQSGDKVHIHLTVERSEAGDMIRNSEDTLKGALKKQGISLGSLAVNVGSEQKGNYTGNNGYNRFGTYGSGNVAGDPEQGEDQTVLAVIDLEHGILHWTA